MWIRIAAFICLLLLPIAAPSSQAPTLGGGFVKTSDRVAIHYVEAGSNRIAQQSQTILFIPGWTMPGWIWEKQIARFSQSHRVVAMDPRCQGESSQTTDGLSPAARARDIKAVVDQLQLAPVVLVGWSMAAGEIASYVDQFGTKDVAAIVFVDEVPSEMAPTDYKRVLAFMDRFVEDRRGNGEKFVRSFFKKPQPEAYLKRVVAASLQTPTNTAVALLVGKFAMDLTPTLKKIDKPTLIVAADNSDEYHAAQKQIAGSRLEVFDDAGHALFVDDAERFNSLLDEFLNTSHPSGLVP